MRTRISFLFSLLFLTFSQPAFANECPYRGELDAQYCDADMDLVADLAPAGQCLNPDTLTFTYPPVENPTVYEKAFANFQQYLEDATGKRVVYYTVQTNTTEVEAMREGKLHIAGFSTGPTEFAVNFGGYIPMAVKGTSEGFQGYNLIVVVRKDSGIKRLVDLKGKKVAHTSSSSNSGNLAPRALFRPLGITPDKDYAVIYAGKHDQSVTGVINGDYDAAMVASDVYDRMATAERVNGKVLQIIYRSPKFPTSSFGYSNQLCEPLVQKIVGAFHTYRFPQDMKKDFKGADRFYPITYKTDWKIIREIAEVTGNSYGAEHLPATK